MKKPLGSTWIGRYLFVRTCCGCREILSGDQWENAFCDPCLVRYRGAKQESCPQCFLNAHQCRCMPAGLSRSGMISLRSLVFYHSQKRGEPQNQMIYRLKEHPNARIAAFLSRELSEAIREELTLLGYGEHLQEVRIVGIPRGRRAKNLHGHDQAPFLAQAIGEALQIPSLEAIGRKRGGKEQKTLEKTGRFQNIRHRFFATEQAGEVQGRCVLLLDDVVTTGASMAACTKLLRDCGAKEILGLSIGKTLAHSSGGGRPRKG